ncbi:MAG: ATPase, T2SS/T4P/T4SS family [Chloroflexota bacterium]
MTNTRFNLTAARNGNGVSRIGDAMQTQRLVNALNTDPYELVFARVRDHVMTDREEHLSQADITAGKSDTRERVRQIACAELKEHNRLAPTLQLPLLGDDAIERILDDIFGLGPLEALMRDETIEDIFVVGPDCVMSVGAAGMREHGEIRFPNPDVVVSLVNRAVAHEGKHLDPVNPMLDARLRNKARIHAVMDPIAEPSPAITIRKRRLVARHFDDLIRLGTLTPQAGQLITLLVKARVSILVAGATGAGKTNFLNALGTLLPPSERVVTIEDTRELELPHKNVVYLITRLASERTSEITQRHLVKQALRMRPQRLIMGEARDGAAADIVQAMNTGHEGTWASVHADSAGEALRRMEALYRQGFPDLQTEVIREELVRAFNVVVFIRRMEGSVQRRVTEIIEVPGAIEHGVIARAPLFVDEGRGLQWTHQWPAPALRKRLADYGLDFREVAHA